MSFPNLDKRPPKSILTTKVTSFPTNDKERLPIPDKRTTSLKSSLDSQANKTNKSSNGTSVSNTTSSITPAAVKANEYTKTSLDRPSPQDRAKKRLILHQQQQQLHHQQQKQNPEEQPQQETTTPQLEQLDPSDDVFINYYKQVNSANKTFSTFRGPPPDPTKYLRKEDQAEETLKSPENQIVSNCFKVINEEKTEEEEGKQDNILDYTPLSFDTNYVKVSPPKLMRRQKKSAGSESDSSGQSTNAFAIRKLKKEKAQSPNKKVVNFATDEICIERLPEATDSSNDSSNSDVFIEDSLLSHRVSTASNISEEFPPPPPQLLEPNLEYISLENAEKGFLTQNLDETRHSTINEQVFKRDEFPKPLASNETKAVNKIGTVFPRQINNINKELLKPQSQLSPESISSNANTPQQAQTIYTSTNSNAAEPVMELKFTLRLEGNGTSQKMTVQQFKEDNTETQNVRNENTASKCVEFNSAIVTQICQAVTTLAKDQLVKDESVTTMKKHKTNENANNSKTNLLYDEKSNCNLRTHTIDTSAPKCFPNSVYGLAMSSELSEKTASQTFPNKKSKTPIETCNSTMETNYKCIGKSPKKQSLADYRMGRVTTVAEVHHSADNLLHNYTALDMKPKTEKNVPNETPQQRYTSIKQHSLNAKSDQNKTPNDKNKTENDKNKTTTDQNKTAKDKKEEGDDSDLEKLSSSVMTHMNWDDLMQEAQSLGIPLNRPSPLIDSNNPTVSPCCHQTLKENRIITPATTVMSRTLENFSPRKPTFQCPSLSHANRPSSIDSAVGVSVCSSSKSMFTLHKNSAPTLASHKAALQKTSPFCANEKCCCTSPCNIYDQPKKSSHRSFSTSNKQCRCNERLISCCRPIKQSPIKHEKRFYSFRIKLANLFCKRLCGKSSERQRYAEKMEQRVCYKASSESYKCTCTTRTNYHHDNISSSMSAKQLITKKVPNGHAGFSSKKDLGFQSFLSDTALTCKKNVRSTKFLSNGSCLHNHDCHHPSKHKKNSPEHHTEENVIDLLQNLEKLKNHAWYWGAIGFEEAESLLANKKDGSFLVRDSSDDRYILSLSFRSDNLTHHTRIEQHKGRFSFFSHWSPQHSGTVDQFIMEAMELSKHGKSLYYLKAKHPSSVPIPVRLLYPVLQK